MKKIIALAVVAAALTMTGCAQRVADLTLASTKNYNINGNHFEKGARVLGHSNMPVILVPMGIPSVKDATDRAIEKDKCAVALSDVVVREYNHSFLFGVIGISVEGNLVIDRNQPGCEK